MDLTLKQKVIHAAKVSWDKKDLLETGMLLFERIPLPFRPLWGADVLEFAGRRIVKTPQIQDVITFARTPDEWANGASTDKGRKAHNFFDAVRLLTLAEERKDTKDNFYIDLLLLAENVAKVTYNAYGYGAPFDHNAGWWIPAILKSVADVVNENDFSATAWRVLTNERYIELETPKRCNPHCITCKWLQTFEIT